MAKIKNKDIHFQERRTIHPHQPDCFVTKQTIVPYTMDTLYKEEIFFNHYYK